MFVITFLLDLRLSITSLIIQTAFKTLTLPSSIDTQKIWSTNFTSAKANV